MPWKKSRKKPQTIKYRLWSIWKGIKKRCYQKGHSNYKGYGKKGVVMCPEWKSSSVTFREWALANGYRPELTIDRIDPKGPYSPENCQWITASENASRANKGVPKPWLRGKGKGSSNAGRKPKLTLTAFGETKFLREWEADPRCKVDREVLRKRVFHKGWDHEKAITTPNLKSKAIPED